MKTTYKILCYTLFTGLILSNLSCKKFVTVDTPITQVSTESAFKNDLTATSVITGIYAQMNNGYINGYGPGAISFYGELSADNLVLANPNNRNDLNMWYRNNLESKYSPIGNNTYWKNIYSLLFTINSSIEELTDNQFLSKVTAKRLLGEAYFLRSFCYSYLVSFYGDVPLVLTSNYATNSKIARSPVSEVYNQIISDLAKAEVLLDNNYVSSEVSQITENRIRPNLAAVNALQARVFLYQKNYHSAELAASKVIDQTPKYHFTNLASTFLANSPETIWALQPVNLGYNTMEAQLFTLPATGFDYDHPVYLSKSFMDSFEAGDERRNKWIGRVSIGSNSYPYPTKYKRTFISGSSSISEYTIVLRLAEQYLIRAEARNEQGKTTDAVEDINALRTRSRAAVTDVLRDPLPNLPNSLTQDELRVSILKERRVELFTEWGHRWFDLRRTGNIDQVMIEAENDKGGTWSSFKSLYPIPVSEILLNSAIIQNPGY